MWYDGIVQNFKKASKYIFVLLLLFLVDLNTTMALRGKMTRKCLTGTTISGILKGPNIKK
jgi:hypothetical protein